MNETESGVLQSLDWLDAVLKGDYKDLMKLQERSKSRLQALRDAALLEEQEYSIILQAQVCGTVVKTRGETGPEIW